MTSRGIGGNFELRRATILTAAKSGFPLLATTLRFCARPSGVIMNATCAVPGDSLGALSVASRLQTGPMLVTTLA